MDKRIEKTRKSIHNAFISLLIDKKNEKITVTELARKANIDRKTFYLHYNTIDDVMLDFSHYLLEKLTDKLREQDFFSKPLNTSCFYKAFNEVLQDDLAFFRHIAAVSKYDIFWERSKEIMTQSLLHVYRDSSILPEDQLYVYIRFLLAGILDIYRAWLLGEVALTLEEAGSLTNEITDRSLVSIKKPKTQEG